MLLFTVHKLAVIIQIMFEFTGRAKPEKYIRQSIHYGAVLVIGYSVF